jgi:hypothetical protein
MISDLTIIFLTANRVPHVWAEFQKDILLEAAAGLPIITISREPLSWGQNILQTEPYGISNIYFQMLKGARLASTKYIAVAEDDVLYPKEHFEYRPPEGVFSYNKNRFNVFTWGRPTYFWKDRIGNSTFIAERLPTIEALEERFEKYPEGTPERYTGEIGRANVEGKLGIKRRSAIWFETEISVVKIDHELGIDRLARTHRKGMGILKSYDIPHWGKAEDVVKKFI